MSSIQASLLARPLPLSEAKGSSPLKLPNPQALQAEKVAKDFESVFTSMMMKEMRKSLESGSFFGDDKSDIYGGLFDQFVGQHLADAGGIGMAKMVREALNRITPGEQLPTVPVNTQI